MKPSDFEDNFTAWLDGRLDKDKSIAFEREMLARGFDPAAEREAAEKMSILLYRHSAAPELSNADFFQHQLLHRMELADRKPERASAGWWSFPRIAWASALSLLIAGSLFAVFIAGGGPTQQDLSPYFATIVDARTSEPGLSVDTIYDEHNPVTVVWIGGLDYMAGDIVAQ
ncbi:MAG: hypothetical protein ABMA13_12945 [Chthoniobacteraceae bacterium]